MINKEQSLIGSIILKESAYLDVAGIIDASDFMTTNGKEAWLAISSEYGKRPIDIHFLYSSMNDKKWVVDSSSMAVPHPRRLAVEIKEHSRKAKLKGFLCEKIKELNNIKYTSDDCLSDMMDIYQSELGKNTLDCGISSVIDRFNDKREFYKKSGFGISTGFKSFDRDYITYRPGHLWVIGAWTSVGKTTFMVKALTNIIHDARCAVFSTEMVEEQNVAKIIACNTGVNSNAILSGNLNDNLDSHVSMFSDELRNTDLHIYDKIRTTSGIATQCRKLNLVKQLDVVFIDFLQNLDVENGKKYDAMSNAAIALQNLAHELRCTIVCLSQLPNSAGKLDSGILEFKGAGEIAAAADIGALMKRAKEDNRVIMFDVRKNRHGACNKYKFRYDESWSDLIDEGRFEE